MSRSEGGMVENSGLGGDLVGRIDQFVRNVVIPYEGDARCTAHGPSDELVEELRDEARSAGLLTPAHWIGRIARHKCTDGTAVSGCWLLTSWTARAQHHGAGRGQYVPPKQDRYSGAKVAVPPSSCRRRGPLRVSDDGACILGRRGFGPFDPEDYRPQAG